MTEKEKGLYHKVFSSSSEKRALVQYQRIIDYRYYSKLKHRKRDTVLLLSILVLSVLTILLSLV